MDFTFTEDQLLFQSSVRDFLAAEVTPERIRQSWEREDGRDAALWQQLTKFIRCWHRQGPICHET